MCSPPSDPVRRAIVERLDGKDFLVSELAERFAIPLPAVSRHISKCWQSHFDTLAAWLDQIERAKHELAQRGTTKRNSLTKE